MKKTLAVLLLVVPAFLPLFAGGNTQRQSTGTAAATAVTAAPGQFPLTKTKANLTVLIRKSPSFSDLNDNEATKWYEDYTNVHVTYIHTPYEGTKAATNLLIASGEYPDIIMSSGLDVVDIMNYGTQGIFIPINNLIDQHGYYFKEVEKKIPDIRNTLTMPDGNIYVLPHINEAYHMLYYMKAWINEDWLKKLNLPTPTTTSEFADVLRAFKTRDPTGRGAVIPMMGYYAGNPRSWPYVFLLNSFVYFNPFDFLAMKDGRITFVANSEDFRDGLRYVAGLVNEGLIDRVSFTQNRAQATQIGTDPAGPRIGVLTDFVWFYVVGQTNDTADKRAMNYVALAPLKGPKGVQYTPASSSFIGLDSAVITDHAKDPILAFRWLEGLYSDEASWTTQNGVKGIMSDVADPGSLGINKKPAIWKALLSGSGSDENRYYSPFFNAYNSAELRLGLQTDWSDPLAPYSQEPKLYRETEEKYFPYRPRDGEFVPLVLHHTTAESNILARLSEQINTYVLENITAFITGNKNLDRDWAAYVGEFTRLGLPQYLQIKQTAYDRQYGRR
jgi:putative aldouronate transport system substrate-binding protein